MKRVALIDYGIGNVLSVKCAFENQGAEVRLISSPEEILKIGYLVLPGVGAFADGMKELHERNLVDAFYREKRIAAVIQKGNCYGTQFHPEKSGKMGLKIIQNFIQLKENS